MLRSIVSLTLVVTLLFQALLLAPVASACGEMQSAAAVEDCPGHSGHANDGCPCCAGGGVACAGSCAAVALPVPAVAVTASAAHPAVVSVTAPAPSSHNSTPPTPPPIA